MPMTEMAMERAIAGTKPLSFLYGQQRRNGNHLANQAQLLHGFALLPSIRA